MRQRPQPKREVPSQPTPARSSGSCSPWHLPSRLQLAVPAFSAVQQLQPRDRRGAGHLVLCSPPSYLHLILIHTAIHAPGNAHAVCTALHCTGALYVHRSPHQPQPSSPLLRRIRLPESEQRCSACKVTQIAGFREEPGARLLLNARGWLVALLTASADGAAEMRY